MAKRDPSTLSNYHAWRTRHTTLDLRIDFANRELTGNVTLDLESLTDGQSDEVTLDCQSVHIATVEINSSPTTWEIGPETKALGSPLQVAVPLRATLGQIVKVKINFRTTDKCTALLWLGPEQTGNDGSFVFSQCYSIHARTLFPCQDTPDVKSTYAISISSPRRVVSSGLPKGEQNKGDEKTYFFEQNIPIPTYLFALASGNLATASIGPNSCVVSSPKQIEQCRQEFEGGICPIMREAEALLTPYVWGQYNLLIMPHSFPYGGMEHPIFTFASPTIITGDGQGLRDVIPHELSHSWSGNLVTNASWEHYWLNEGWTVYLERRLASKIHEDAYFGLASILGWKRLQDDVERLGPDHEFTKLCVNLSGVHPDDAFCSIPYEKGFCLIYLLERVVGRNNFDDFIRHYFTVWAEKSLDSNEFQETFLTFFADPKYVHLKDQLGSIKWEELFYQPGLPEKPSYDTSLVDTCYQQAEAWKDKIFVPTENDIRDWSSSQKLVLLNAILDFEQPLSVSQSRALGTVYQMSSCTNAILRTAYYQIALRAGDVTQLSGVADFLGQIGTLRYVRQLYKALAAVDIDLAVLTFEKNRYFYHPTCATLVDKELQAIGRKVKGTGHRR